MTHKTEPLDQLGPANAPAAKQKAAKKRSWWPYGLFALVGAFIGVTVYVLTGPYRTLKGIQAAIAFADSQALNEYVDFPTLRQNLKQQLSARAGNQVQNVLGTGLLAQVAGGIANSVVDTSVDALVTPAGLNQLVLGVSLVAGQFQGVPQGTLAQRFEDGHGTFETLGRFTFAVATTSHQEVTLELTRSGLTWQLTNVIIHFEH